MTFDAATGRIGGRVLDAGSYQFLGIRDELTGATVTAVVT